MRRGRGVTVFGALLALVATALLGGCGSSSGADAGQRLDADSPQVQRLQAQAVRERQRGADGAAVAAGDGGGGMGQSSSQEDGASTTGAADGPVATTATSSGGGTAPAVGTTGPPAGAGPAVPPRPRIVQRPIPFPARRVAEMRAYAKRHYGIASARLQPRAIVEHYTDNDSVAATYTTFASDVPDVELHELPATCAHFVIGTDGTIYQLVPLMLMCRHTVGLNDRSIGIEHVGRSSAQVLGNARQLRASLRLTAWLRCRYGIAVADVIGHNESLASPLHHERVARLRGQTHDDFPRGPMTTYRRKLRAMGCATAAT